MTIWLSAGLLFSYAAIALIVMRWATVACVGVTPVHTFTFVAILFTSGLDVGLIMFPLTEFAGYADYAAHPEYAFTNPLAIEFGFWAFLIWGFYFLTCFYFCVIEPRVKFFEIPAVKLINNLVIIGTCAFTAYLMLVNLPWYLPQIGDGKTVLPVFYFMVFLAIALAVYSSSEIKYVRLLSLASTWLFGLLVAVMWAIAFLGDDSTVVDFLTTASLLGGYFKNLHHFMLPINDYHEFYLYWWFAWSIMIGQFTARFVSGIRTWQLLFAMLVVPSIAIGIWFTVLYHLHTEAAAIATSVSIAMIGVGILMVVNSLDSLIRLYTDNLNLTAHRLGPRKYFLGNVLVLSALTLMFRSDFLRIEWVGALVIAIYFACFAYILLRKWPEVAAIKTAPPENSLDFGKIELDDSISEDQAV